MTCFRACAVFLFVFIGAGLPSSAQAQSTSSEALTVCKEKIQHFKAIVSRIQSQAEAQCERAEMPMSSSTVTITGCEGCNALQSCLVQLKYWGARIEEVTEEFTKCSGNVAGFGGEDSAGDGVGSVDDVEKTERNPDAMRARIREIEARKGVVAQRQGAIDTRVAHIEYLQSEGDGSAELVREKRDLENEKTLLEQERIGITQEAKVLEFYL